MRATGTVSGVLALLFSAASVLAQGGIIDKDAAADREARVANEKAVNDAIKEFQAATSASKSISDTATAIRALGVCGIKDDRILRQIGRYLVPRPDDPNNTLVITAAEVLGGFTGSATAANSIMHALPMFAKKAQNVEVTLATALGRTGHESGIPVLLNLMHNMNVKTEPALAAAASYRYMPKAAAIEPLLKKWEEWEFRRAVRDLQWREMVKVIPVTMQVLTGVTFTKAAECRAWWARNASTVAKQS